MLNLGKKRASPDPPPPPDRLPNLHKRSKIEMEVAALLMLNLLGTVSLATFCAALCQGDDMGKIDAAIQLANGFHVLFEWDCGYWHTDDPDQVRQDVEKTVRMLKVCAKALVVRVRADGAPDITEEIHSAIDECDSLDEEDKERVVLVHLEKGAPSNHGNALKATSDAIHPLLVKEGGKEQRKFAENMTNSKKAKTKAAIDLVQQTIRTCVKDYDENVKKLKKALGGTDAAAKRVLNAHGVVARLPEVLAGIKALVDKCKIPISALKKIVGGCLAVRIGDEGFALAVNAFRDYFHLSMKSLVTVLDRGGVVKRIGEPGFVNNVLNFMEKLGIVTSKVVTVLGDGTACRVHKRAFLENAKAFQTYFEVKPDGMATLLGRNSFAARLDEATFLDVVVAFMDDKDLRFEKGDVTKFLSSSACSRIGQDAFLNSVKKLKGECGFKKEYMVTILGSDSLASRMVSDPKKKEMSLVQCVRILNGHLKLQASQLQKVLVGVASHLDDPHELVQNIKRVEGFALSKDQLVTVMNSTSVAKWMQKATWIQEAEACSAAIGDAGKFATLLSKNSFASRLKKKGFSEKLTWVLDDVTKNVSRFQGSFWGTELSVAKSVVDLLVNEYGWAADDLPAQNGFWSKIKKEGVAKLKTDLASCATTEEVTSHVRKMNNGRPVGRGATRCAASSRSESDDDSDDDSESDGSEPILKLFSRKRERPLLHVVEHTKVPRSTADEDESLASLVAQHQDILRRLGEVWVRIDREVKRQRLRF